MDNKHSEIMLSLGVIQGKTDGIIQRLDTINGRLNAHDEKIQDIEVWRGNLKGVIAIVTAIAGVAASLAVAAVRYLLGK